MFTLVVSSILLTSPFRLHLLVLFLNSHELLSIFHSVCFFACKRGHVLPPKSVSLPTSLIWLKEDGDLLRKGGENACLPPSTQKSGLIKT